MTHNSTHRACRDRFQTLQFYEEALTFMAFCANCGAQMEGRSCAKCGATAASALCYALGLITGVIFLILEPYNKNRNIRFHAFQSIFLTVAWIIFRIVLGIVFAAIWSLGGLFLASSISLLITLCGVLLWLYMLISAYQGKKVVLPIIGPLAEKQASPRIAS